MSGPIPFGRYQLLERLAAGSVADIYRAATQAADGSSVMVVIKRIRDDLSGDPAFSGAFVDEAKLASSLDHANIAKVYEWGQQDGALFIAMEYIEGTNLASLQQSCSEQGLRFPPTMAIHIISELLAGLGYAHGLSDAFGHPLGIVHRGVSPQNVVLSSAGQVKLIDFGVARASSRVQGTRPGVFSGQITYMAPEVVARQAVDARADQFSVGVMLYELLTGLKLHAQSGGGPQVACQAMQARPPSTVHSDIPAELDGLIARATALDPAARYSDTEQMRAELQAFLQRWDTQTDADGLSSFLVEALSGRSAGKPAGGFAFGEATSHWFAEGDELIRADPVEVVPEVAPPTEAVVVPEMVAPVGGFASGSTVMAVEAGGLGKSRHLKAFGIVAGGAAVVVLLVVLIVSSLSDGPSPMPSAEEPQAPDTSGFSGAVQVRTVPDNALIFVDGDPVEPAGDPPRIMNLRAGQRRFKIVAPGYLAWEGDVILERATPKVIEQELQPRTGVVVIKSSPKAMVFFGGKRVGKTPVRIPDVQAPKTHKVVLRARRHLPLRFDIKPSDWPKDPDAELMVDKQLKKKGRRRRR